MDAKELREKTKENCELQRQIFERMCFYIRWQGGEHVYNCGF